MFLKSLEIFGFKSFADRTRIEFADGISALLGPNGCGKSNVVDAIKWVLGEQASKSLRAEAMEDVIFNGTESRKALSVAEVTLVLGNENGLLPLDMAEVVVRRRLYRNGESEYFINGTPVRLKDIRELFYDTGVGKSAYSIMEQGRIDQVLSHKPEERRALFEEAAGITKYRMRGQEADRKLEKTDENLRQVDGILTEVRRSHDTLKKQAEKTSSYHGLKESLFQVELSVQLIRLREAIENREKQKKALAQVQEERDRITKSIDGINETLESSLDEMNSMEARLIESQKRIYGLDIEKTNHDSQIKLLNERIQEIDDKIRADQSRIQGIREKRDALDRDIASGRTALQDIAAEAERTDGHIAKFTATMETAQKRIQSNNEEIAGLEEALVRNQEQQEAIRESLRELTDHIVGQLDRSLGESGYDSRLRKDREDRLSRIMDSLGISLRGRMDLLGDLERVGTGKEGLVRLREGLKEMGELLEELKAALGDYRDSLPLFLDEFLAPQGTITRKRDLDTRDATLRNDIAAARQRLSALGEDNRQLSTRIDECRETLGELRLAKERLIGQQRAVEEQVARSTMLRDEAEGQIKDALAVTAEDQGRIAGLTGKIGEIRTLRKELDSRDQSLRKELAELEKGISTRSRTLMSKEKQLKSQMGQLAGLQEKVERLSVALAEAQGEIRNIHENFLEKYSRSLGEYESGMYEIQDNLKDLKDRSQDFKDRLRDLGQVNLMAPEEYAEVKERFDFLNSQIEDLRKAKEDLMKVTREIRTESSALFLETYEAIRRHFHVLFRRLFGGGRAEIRLLDPEHVLESGIEIYAQPPGKKLENIALLSGGEKALTAVALLFATYIVKPSPFCLLDEIDAALDESNVGRFVSMLMEFGETSQFIVITHNKKTVTGARTLLGVTMEESGVSRIIAVRLSSDGPVDPDPAQAGPEPEEPLSRSGMVAAAPGDAGAAD